MEDEEDVVMVSPSVEQREESQLNVGDSSEIAQVTAVHGGDGEERESEVENVEGIGSRGERGEGADDAREASSMAEVRVSGELEVRGDGLSVGDSSEIAELVMARDEVEESKLERDGDVVGVEVAPLMEAKVSGELASAEVADRGIGGEESELKSRNEEVVDSPLPEVKVSDELAVGEVAERGIGGEGIEELNSKLKEEEEDVAPPLPEVKVSDEFTVGEGVTESILKSEDNVAVYEAELNSVSVDVLESKPESKLAEETEVNDINEHRDDNVEHVATVAGEIGTVTEEISVKNEGDEDGGEVEAMEEEPKKSEEMEARDVEGEDGKKVEAMEEEPKKLEEVEVMDLAGDDGGKVEAMAGEQKKVEEMEVTDVAREDGGKVEAMEEEHKKVGEIEVKDVEGRDGGEVEAMEEEQKKVEEMEVKDVEGEDGGEVEAMEEEQKKVEEMEVKDVVGEDGGKVEAMEEEHEKAKEMEVKNEEVVEKDGALDGEASSIAEKVEGDGVREEKEGVSCANEVEGDGIVKTTDLTPLKEEVQMVEEVVEKVEEKEGVSCANEVEGDGILVQMVDEVVKKVEQKEGVSCANEVEGDRILVQMVGEVVEKVEQKEEVSCATEVEGDGILVQMVGEVIEKVEQKEGVSCANEVEGDGILVQMVDEVVEKVEHKEGVVCANEVEGDEISQVGNAPPLKEEEEVQMVDELAEKKAENEEHGKDVEAKEGEEELQEESKEEGDEETDHSPSMADKEEMLVEEGEPIGENEMEVEEEEEGLKSGSGSGGKRKRARNAKAGVVRTPSRKVVGEDVCFICLDGGDLVLCDRRGCPKAYHPSCVDHDEEFFKTKGHWYCGWHICNQCSKNATFKCCTCQFSLCKACTKDAAVFCVKGNKGFCESCMKTIMLIENSEQSETGQEAFSDKSSWEYLFKDYWLEQKEKLCITSDELSHAKKPSDKQHASVEGNNDADTDSDSIHENSELSDSKRKKAKKNSKSVDNDSDNSAEKNTGAGKRKSKRRLRSQTKDVYNSDSENSSPETSGRKGGKARKLSKSRSKGAQSNAEWASKELMEFIMHMKNGDRSVLTQFDVQGLLLEYIKRNKLRDPRRQSQIICDSMLQKLFHKPRVGHFEMLKLLESHFFLKDADDNQGNVANAEMKQLDADDNIDSPTDGGKNRGKKSRKSGGKGSQSNLDDYAAIDIHNINLIFLRRNLMEALLENPDTFHDKAVGAFVRIRISGSNRNQDIYRLVQITGTSKAAQPYKVGKRTTDIMLEILNLDKTETVSIDTMSNQDFSEDECKRLRQSIKCGLINRMTVGDIVDKARELQEIRVLDWLEAEIVRLSHLRDRASEKGRKKELRECVEKLQLLKTPEERQRKLDEIPEVHADPKMDPSYESEEEMDTTREAIDRRRRETGFNRRSRDDFSSSRKGISSIDSWSANARPPSQKWDPTRNSSSRSISSISSRKDDSYFTSPTRDHGWSNGADKGSPRFNNNSREKLSDVRAEHPAVRSDMSDLSLSHSPRISTVPGQTGQTGQAGQTDSKGNESEKVWHYRDPAGKVQGPFSMTQLRKWSNTGYFPIDLRVWRVSQVEGDSILLTDILSGKVDPTRPGNARSSGPGPGPGPVRAPFQSSQHQHQQPRVGIERLPSPTPTSPSTPIVRSNLSRKSKWDVAGTTDHHFAPSTPKPDLSLSSTITNSQRIAPQQSTVQLTGQNPVMNQSNWAQPQPVPNVPQPVPGQTPSVYGQGWSTAPGQVTYGQWSAVTASNQTPPPPPPSYNNNTTGYSAPGNNVVPVTPNLATIPMPWNGQQQQQMGQVWTGGPTMGQVGQVGQQQGGFIPGGVPNMAWSGQRPAPSHGNTNHQGWVGGPPGNAAGGWNGDQTRNSRGSR